MTTPAGSPKENPWKRLLRGEVIPIDEVVRPIFQLLGAAIPFLLTSGAVMLALAVLIWWWNPLVWQTVQWGRLFLVLSLIALSISIFYWGPKWFQRCIQELGGTPPCMAVVTLFGKPVNAIMPGGYIVFWPFVKLIKFPMGPYSLPFAVVDTFSSEQNIPIKDSEGTVISTRHLASVAIEKVDISLSLRWPRPDKDDYKMLQTIERAATKEGEEIPEITETVSGRDLLIQTYLTLPYDPMKITPDQLGELLEGSITDVVRRVLGERNHEDIRYKQGEWEARVKDLLLAEEGNLFHDLAIPRACMDILIPGVKFPRDVEEAFRAQEVAEGRGRGTVATAEAETRARVIRAAGAQEAAAAEAEAERIKYQTRLDALFSKSVSSDLAAMLAFTGGASDAGDGQGQQGQGLNIDPLLQIMVLNALGGLSENKKQQEQGHPWSKDSFFEWLNSMNPSERRQFETDYEEDMRKRTQA